MARARCIRTVEGGRMKSGPTAVGIIGSAVIAFAFMLPLAASAQPTPDECTCQQNTGKAQGKFAYAKAKCIVKCEKGERAGRNPGSDCDPPYGGTTAECVNKAEAKAVAKETKCRDCPECYTGGNCTLDGTNRTASTENQL